MDARRKRKKRWTIFYESNKPLHWIQSSNIIVFFSFGFRCKLKIFILHRFSPTNDKQWLCAFFFSSELQISWMMHAISVTHYLNEIRNKKKTYTQLMRLIKILKFTSVFVEQHTGYSHIKHWNWREKKKTLRFHNIVRNMWMGCVLFFCSSVLSDSIDALFIRW